ncbi:hypothetical protein [Pseudoramibacter faecis]|uniref:hypothetical protein n=1 Tax=Pseudoramibacter faecis TaxID=3108534 RepID=UPI002E771D3B|nr:hypothetical protein [Pseudoramibacter sp. HA2172]
MKKGLVVSPERDIIDITHPERTAGKPCAAKKTEKDKGKGLTGMKEGAYNSCRCRFGRRPGDELKKL